LKYQEEEVMKFLKVTLAVLFIAVLLAGCAPATKPVTPTPTPAPTPAPVPSTFNNAGQPITVPIGVSFTISVSSNPSTGYSWVASYDHSLLQLIKQSTPSESGLMGASGTENFEFKGMRAGNTAVYLNYQRGWEPNSPTTETKTFNVTITG
jgi:inhibitor of cysteine peptidase